MDALGHLDANTRYKFQTLLMDAGCGSILVDKPGHTRCKLCDRSLEKPYKNRPAASVVIWHEGSMKSLHVCTDRACVLKAANRFHEYREELERESK